MKKNARNLSARAAWREPAEALPNGAHRFASGDSTDSRLPLAVAVGTCHKCGAVQLEAVAGLMGVVAVRLVPLKHAARVNPTEPAEHRVPPAWLVMLRSLRKRPIITVHDFVRELAGRGGHLARKSDGEPGWQTLWRGLDKLILCLRGHETRKKCG